MMCNNDKNPVSMLNEYCQQMKIAAPEFNTITTSGPSHSTIFTMQVTVNNKQFIESGPNKKLAKKKCALMAINHFKIPQYFEQQSNVFKYKIAEINTNIEQLWNNNSDLVEIVMKKYNDDESLTEFKTITLQKYE